MLYRLLILIALGILPLAVNAQNSRGVGFSQITNNEDVRELDVNSKRVHGRVTQRLKRLGRDIAFIGSKKNTERKKDYTIESTLFLFVDKGKESIMQVSSVTRKKLLEQPIKRYLTGLKKIKYDRVKIEWDSISYCTKFNKQPDGTWRGTATVRQKFIGEITEPRRDVKSNYSDITTKNITIILVEERFDGQQIMTVYLHDIDVIHTRRSR